MAERQLDNKDTRAQLPRYVLVGAGNTVVGYGIYSALTYLFSSRLPHGYIVAALIANIVAITVAYSGYKFLVFKTQGDYVAEYFRFCVIYGIAFALNLLLLPCVVELLEVNPYKAQALLTCFIVLCSYVGHRRFSFRSKN